MAKIVKMTNIVKKAENSKRSKIEKIIINNKYSKNVFVVVKIVKIMTFIETSDDYKK